MSEADAKPEHLPKPRWTAKVATAMITRWKRSGLSQAAFCRREEIALATLNYWIRKSDRSNRGRGTKQQFVEVKSVGVPKVTHGSPIELVTPSGFKLNLSSGFSSDDLHRALSVLRSSSC